MGLLGLPARLRPSGYAGHHASPFGHLVAAPREARRAKRGGARRDRTADLLHAMQALSQLSYGPVTCRAPQISWRAGMTLNHSSGPISSLFVVADVANDVGHVLVALFLVGDEGGIVVVIVLDGLVDLDIFFRFGNHGLDLARVLLGVGLFQRHQFLGLGGLRRVGGGGGGGSGARS